MYRIGCHYQNHQTKKNETNHNRNNPSTKRTTSYTLLVADRYCMAGGVDEVKVL